MLKTAVIFIALQLSTQLIDASVIPIPRQVPALSSRASSGPDADYLHGYDGNPNSSVLDWALSDDSEFSFILQVALSMANGGGASTGEVLRIASQLTPGDFDSWFNEFYFLGEQIHAQALEAKTTASARSAYFRASTYYRMSSFFLVGNASDPRLYGPWQQALDDFDAAIALQDVPGVPFTVPGPGYTVPGYFWKSPTVSRHNPKVPTVIVGSGYDAPQQDSFHSIGLEVLSRGWNFVTYEGGGQTTTRRQQGVGFTPEWWKIVTPVVDYLSGLPEVDMENLALGGISFGGILAPVAASREPRLKAVMSIDGLIDFQETVLNNIGSLADVFASANATEFDAKVEELYPELPTKMKWFLDQGRWSFNTDSAYDFINQTAAYVVTPEAVANISAYGWVGKGENDTLAGGQEDTLLDYYNSVGQHPGTLYFFPTNVGGGSHSQTGAEQQLAQAVLDWLSTIFGNTTSHSFSS